MNVTGSPPKRNRANAISPTASITTIDCPSHLRTNASIGLGSCENVTNGFRAEADRLAAPPRAPEPAVAGYARSLPHLALRGDAAANSGERGYSLLRALPAPLPHDRGARLRLRRRGASALERPGLLRPWPKPACRGQSGRLNGFFSKKSRRHRGVAGDREIDGGGERGGSFWRAGRGPGPQSETAG